MEWMIWYARFRPNKKDKIPDYPIGLKEGHRLYARFRPNKKHHLSHPMYSRKGMHYMPVFNKKPLVWPWTSLCVRGLISQVQRTNGSTINRITHVRIILLWTYIRAGLEAKNGLSFLYRYSVTTPVKFSAKNKGHVFMEFFGSCAKNNNTHLYEVGIVEENVYTAQK